MKLKKGQNYVEKVSNGFEVAIAILLLIVIVIKLIETSLNIAGNDVTILTFEFERILSIALGFVIGIEFVKMLCKHTADAVVDVLLFTIARQMVVYHESMWDILVGVIVIAGMFATKKYLINFECKICEKAEEE
jgi:hypothetical protein